MRSFRLHILGLRTFEMRARPRAIVPCADMQGGLRRVDLRIYPWGYPGLYCAVPLHAFCLSQNEILGPLGALSNTLCLMCIMHAPLSCIFVADELSN